MRKFEVLGVIGIGAYGIVLKARNKENNEISILYSNISNFDCCRKLTLAHSRDQKVQGI